MESNDYSLVQGIKNKDKTSLCTLMDSYGRLVIYISSKILNSLTKKNLLMNAITMYLQLFGLILIVSM